ncbi:AAA family ATPase [Shewanella youngdeokensis]|uniref:AAA family ATPase n=1 Tax=Shewanella youngdeokensis TaxID=2999068 RepID=A0ABZ0JZC4_9GAMM|nr:AAA family ATPase [Shewanella sp. DAU334]
MSLAEATLLPSQEALLNRLQHISLYGQQLIVLTGEIGSGKTTLVTALLTELEEFSSALVICPKHCDSAEIRRKILVQILTEPVFDDELPLPESLLQAASELPTASCIVLDDAEYLPLEIWAECIVLSQMSFGGKTVNVTMTSTAEFLNDVLQQLPVDQRHLLLPLDIEPIDCTEREGLYYTLLSRSEAQPFTPREIVKDRLAAQSGTPKEVVTLLELALNGDADKPEKSAKWERLGITLFVIISVTLLAFLYTDKTPTVGHSQKVVFAGKSVLGSTFVADYGEQLLAGYRQQLVTSNRESQALSRTDNQRLDEPKGQVASVNTNNAVPAGSITEETEPERESKVETFSAQTSANIGSVVNNDIAAKKMNKQRSGYTLQLASVAYLASLSRMLDSVKEYDTVMVARYKNRWVVLMGEFDSPQQARQQSLKLTANTDVSAPWIRKWQDLNEYELQDRLPTREINK